MPYLVFPYSRVVEFPLLSGGGSYSRLSLFQIKQCEAMYSRLHLDKHREHLDEADEKPSHPFPLIPESPLVKIARPSTYVQRQTLFTRQNVRPLSIRSAPGHVFNDLYQSTKEYETQQKKEQTAIPSESSYDFDESGNSRKRSKLDPAQLASYLNERGYGVPIMLKSSETLRRLAQKLPRNYKPRILPKNPSYREKIKGRARLDQEMANLKALAFCEQQAPRVFRTASANMKNRDVQFIEEEMRENIQRQGRQLAVEDDDDCTSVIMSPMRQDELFLRIGSWIEDVESALKPSS